MRKYLLSILAALGILSVMILVPVRQGAHASNDGSHKDHEDFVPPTVFQAAGPTVSSIQGTVDQFRAALGSTNNGNAPGPLPNGRREINWDGGGATDTAIVGTPFDGFLVTRGARFETPGSGFVQAPLDGLVTTFGNPTYSDIFQTFSPLRLFSAIESNVTDGLFFIPGGTNIPTSSLTAERLGPGFSLIREAETSTYANGRPSDPMTRPVIAPSIFDDAVFVDACCAGSMRANAGQSRINSRAIKCFIVDSYVGCARDQKLI